ncbi:unnamed protein product [Owenia fusiformis]|uniref:Ferric-chelate reductase 1 n=1 Tax=Owenia fusiformis TaxID=6347 RepID=A0A8S4PBH2_OWEFU|nr:unnamed protein product [Owenia fusiformis]
MKMLNLLWTLMVLTVALTITYGYPSGAPPQACGTMTPGHHVEAQTSPAPYSTNISQTSYKGGDTITVTLTQTGKNNFVGFMIEARRADFREKQDEIIGFFTPVNGTRLACNGTLGNALTHSEQAPHGPLTVIWTAPAKAQGHLVFKVTYLQDFSTFWIDTESPVLYDPTAPPLEEPTTPHGTQPPWSNFNTTSCGTTKGCYSVPQGCSPTNSDCQYFVSWRENNKDVDFELYAKDGEYVAVGFSHDIMMPDTSVVACSMNKGFVEVSNYYNKEYSSGQLYPGAKVGLNNTEGYWTGNDISCRFSRAKIITTDQFKNTPSQSIFNLTQSYYLLVAKGQSTHGEIMMHSVKRGEFPVVTPDKVDFSKYDLMSGRAVYPLVKLHGCFMLVAWMLTATCGMLIARYFKLHWGSSTLGGKNIWFQVHRTCMLLTLLLVIAGVVVIFVYVKGFAEWHNDTLLDLHPILGLIVTGLVLLNPTIALFRPSPTAEKRPIFNWVHWGIGNLALVAAMVQIYTGVAMPGAFVGWNATWLFIGWLIFYVTVLLVLEFYERCVLARKVTDEDTELLDGIDKKPGVEEGDTFQTVFLAIYLTLTFAATGGMLYLVLNGT